MAVLATCALVASVGSSLYCYPHSLSYVNELVGGPLRGHEYFLGGDFDFCQDLFFLRKRLRLHPDMRPLHLAYYGMLSPQVAGIEAKRIPRATDSDGPEAGWYAISVNCLHGFGSTHPERGADYEYLLDFNPVARAGYSILIYHLTPTQANDLREQLGLPPIPDEVSE